MPAVRSRGSSQSSGLPTLWLVCRGFGISSEAWLRRQAVGIRNLETRILCWGVHSEPGLREPAGGIHELRFPGDNQITLSRWLQRAKGLPSRNFYGSTGRELATICRLLEEDRPDVILGHFGFNALRVLPAARRMGVPLVAHFHGVNITAMLRNRWYRWSLKASLDKFAAVVVVADYQRDWLLAQGYPAERLHVIPCGAPTSEFRPSGAVGKQPCRFLTVGRFVPKKSPLLTIEAFAECARRVPGSTLTMIGDGPLLPQARALVHRHELGDRVFLLDRQPVSVVLEEMGRAGAFVQHSITAANGDREGWPVAVAEAMASGIPVIGTRHAGMLDQIVDGRTGYAVEEGDSDGLVEAMVELAENPELRRTMGEAARARIEKHFETSEMIGRLEAVLIQAAGRPVDAAP